MLEIIEEWCKFHNMCFLIQYRREEWIVRLYNAESDSLHCHASTLAEAFTIAKNSLNNNGAST